MEVRFTSFDKENACMLNNQLVSRALDMLTKI